MIIKNNNQAVDVQKNSHVSWEGQKDSKRFYVKKTVSYGKWRTNQYPQIIPSISWEGGTTVNCKCWVERTNTIREGFSTWTEIDYHYLIPSFQGSLINGIKLNTTGNAEDGWTITFPKRDETSEDLILGGIYQYSDETGRYPASITITQTKRDKYVTKLDNAVITVDNIPASGGTVSSGTLTYRKTFSTGETENATENITFPTVSATTKGTTETGVTDIKTIAAGGTNQKSTTIDGVTLTHPAFTVKQEANVKSVKTGESKTTEKLLLSASPTVLYSSGGTVTLQPSRMYTLNKTVYQYTSGSTSGGGTDKNQGPENLNAASFNYTYTSSDSSFKGTLRGTGTLTIPSSSSARTITFTIQDGSLEASATVTQKLDGPDPSKAFYYTDLKITTFSYSKSSSGYHFPASGGTITATDCTLEGTYIWHYTSMEGKTSQETVSWTLNDLTTSMYTFTPTSKTAESLGTTSASANNNYATISVEIKNLKHTYNGKQYDVKDNSSKVLTQKSSATLTRQGNSGTQSSVESKSKLTVSVDPTTYNYKGGSATLKAVLTKTYNVSWTSGATSTNDTNTDVTSGTTFTGSYRIGSSTTDNSITVSGSSVTIPNLGTSKDSRKYTFTGRYNGITGTATLSQTGNTTTYTVTFNINNTYAKWYRGSSAITDTTVTKSFAEGTKYTDLIPDEVPTWTEGSNYKYTFENNYSTTTTGAAVSSSSTLASNDVKLYARWTNPTAYIKVYWDPKGGTLTKTDKSSTTTSSIYDYHGKSFKCQPSDLGYNNYPTRTNYTFISWCSNAGLVCYSNSFPISINNTMAVVWDFYASWAVTNITITWDGNGGTWNDGKAKQTNTGTYGKTIDAYSSNPKKTSTTSKTYDFKGWNISSDSTTTITFPYNLTVITGSLTLYAIYSSSTRSYTITWTSYPIYNIYSNDDKTWSSSTTTSVKYGTKYKDISIPSGIRTSLKNTDGTEEYRATGDASWYTTADGSVVIKDNETTVTGNTTFYLHFSTSYRVILNCNGGQVSSSDKSTSWTIYVTSFKYDDYKPVRTDYTFAGWNIRNTDTSGSITGTATVSSTTTYYATWTKDSVTITWYNHTNGAVIIWADGTAENKQTYVKKGTKYNELTPPEKFADTIIDADIKYTAAWYTKITGGTLISQANSEITSATTVYTQFSIAGYKVILNPNSGTLTVGSSSYTSSSPYTTYVKSINLGSYTPIRSNYGFNGWSTTSTATSGSSSTVTINSSTTYYATWQQYGSITLNVNGGILNYKDNTYTTTYTFYYSQPSLSLYEFTPTKDNYTFVGWNEDKNATTGNTSFTLGVTAPSSHIWSGSKTYYAIWKSVTLTPILLVLSS